MRAAVVSKKNIQPEESKKGVCLDKGLGLSLLDCMFIIININDYDFWKDQNILLDYN